MKLQFKPDINKIRAARTEKEKNFIERLEFIKFWVEYIKLNPDENWSKQQNLLINSQLTANEELGVPTKNLIS